MLDFDRVFTIWPNIFTLFCIGFGIRCCCHLLLLGHADAFVDWILVSDLRILWFFRRFSAVFRPTS